MSKPPHAPFDNPFLNDAFDFSRYPAFKVKNTKKSAPDGQRRRVRGRIALFAPSRRGSPSTSPGQRSRNVSEPQLISSTSHTRESWFTNIASARTEGDIASISGSEDIFSAIHRSDSATVACDTSGDRSWFDTDDDQSQKVADIKDEGSCDISGHAELGEYKCEEDSLYSTDSADQDAHLALLSMPVIPQIKLERKATVREHGPRRPPDAAQNQSYLSPRIRDLRTPTSKSSRRYGRILEQTNRPMVFSEAISAGSRGHSLTFEVSRQSSVGLACIHSVSEPMLNSACLSDGEEEPLLKKRADESPHSDVLLSIIDEVESCTGPHGNSPEPGANRHPMPKQVLRKHFKRGRPRSSVNLSTSLSNIFRVVADGYASIDLLRNSKFKPKPTEKPKPHEHVQSAHDRGCKWAPKQGQIVIKVFVPSTDDIWAFHVPQDISLVDFTARVGSKLGLTVFFSGSVWDEPKYYFRTDDRFKSWVKGRIRFGRNLPIVAHVLGPLPLVKLSVDGDSCEIWCYTS